MSDAITLGVGTHKWQVRVPADKLVPLTRGTDAPPLASPAELLRDALQTPIGLGTPLNRALTPDDEVCIVIDERLPALPELLAELLIHLRVSGVASTNITLLVEPPSGEQPWADNLPPEFEEVKIEVHDPAERKELAYLATTKGERRVYMNKTLLEAAFVVVLAGRRFDPILGYTGAETAIFPTFADTEARDAYAHAYSTVIPGSMPNPLRAEASEIAWLTGLPAYVQPIEGYGDTIAEVVVGLTGSSADGTRRQDARWRTSVTAKADLVIAAVSGSADRIRFGDLAFALATSARVVTKGGRIVLLCDAAPELSIAAEKLRQWDDPVFAAKRLHKKKPDGVAAAVFWALAAKRASLFIASIYPDDVIEELYATALESASEVQRLIDAAESVIVIPDAHKTVVEVR